MTDIFSRFALAPLTPDLSVTGARAGSAWADTQHATDLLVYLPICTRTGVWCITAQPLSVGAGLNARAACIATVSTQIVVNFTVAVVVYAITEFILRGLGGAASECFAVTGLRPLSTGGRTLASGARFCAPTAVVQLTITILVDAIPTDFLPRAWRGTTRKHTIGADLYTATA